MITLLAAAFGLIIMLDIVFTLHSIRNSLQHIERCAAWLTKGNEAKK